MRYTILIPIFILFVVICMYRSEYYSLEKLNIKLKWKNKLGIKDNVQRWDIIVYDSKGDNLDITDSEILKDKYPDAFEDFSDVSHIMSFVPTDVITNGTNSALLTYNLTENQRRGRLADIPSKNILGKFDFTVSKNDFFIKDISSFSKSFDPYENMNMTSDYTGTIPNDDMIKNNDVMGLISKQVVTENREKYIHTQPGFFSYEKGSNEYESIFVYNMNDKKQSYITLNIDDDTPEKIRPYNEDNDYILVEHKIEGTTIKKVKVEGEWDKKYWKSIFFRVKSPEPIKNPMINEQFTCKNVPKKVYIYKGSEYKLVPNPNDQNKKEYDCSNYNYTGVAHQYKISTNGRCGPSHGNTRCIGNQCCSKWGWCGGSIGTDSAWCNTWKNVKSRNVNKWWLMPEMYWTWFDTNTWFRKGHNNEYDGTAIDNTPFEWWYWVYGGGWKVSYGNITKGRVLRCAKNDPLGKDNSTAYMYTGDNTIKHIPSDDVLKTWRGKWSQKDYMGFTIQDCAGVKYGGILEKKIN